MVSGSRREQRKKRQLKTREQRQPRRQVVKRILIIVEGIKSERLYLKQIIAIFDIQAESVDIDSTAGTCPFNMVKRAEELYKESVCEQSVYDRVFIVFDRDSHARFQEALNHYATLSSDVFTMIISYPCFEYWLLLHLDYIDAPFSRKGNKSPCDCAAKKISESLGVDDGKSYDTLLGDLSLAMVNFASSNSERSQNRAVQDGNNNPSTNFHELINYLKE